MRPLSTRWPPALMRLASLCAESRMGLTDQRCVSGLISFADPAGNRLEAFHGALVADTAFKPGTRRSGFRTGPQGMGHYPF